MKALICRCSAVGIVSLELPELFSLSLLKIEDFYKKKDEGGASISALCQKGTGKVPLSGLPYSCLFGMGLQDVNRSPVYSFEFDNHDRYY